MNKRFVWFHSSEGRCGVDESCLFDWMGSRKWFLVPAWTLVGFLWGFLARGLV